jgi:hypothetical protein
MKRMNPDRLIEQICTLSTPDELKKVGKALEEHHGEVVADLDATHRIEELRAGKVKALFHGEVFGSVRNRIRGG